MSRVFVFEPVTNSIERAYVHGYVCYLFDEDHRRPSIWETDELRIAIKERLHVASFDPHTDFYLVVGPIIPITLTVSVLQEVYKEYKLLYWHSELREYVPRLIHTTGIQHASKR